VHGNQERRVWENPAEAIPMNFLRIVLAALVITADSSGYASTTLPVEQSLDI